MRPVMHWPFFCQFLQTKLLLASQLGGLCLCPQSLVTFTHRPTTADRCSQCSQTFGNPSQSCSPETRLCCVILSSQVTKVGPSNVSPTPDIHGTDQQITLHKSMYRRMNKTRRGAALLLWGQIPVRVLGQAGGCPSVSVSLSAHPASLWAASLARHGVDPSQKPSKPLRKWIRILLSPSTMMTERPGRWQSLNSPPPRHTPTPMCSGLSAKPQRQASSLAQLAWPRSAGFAIIILGHLIQTERMRVSSSTKTSEPHQDGPTGLLLASFPLNDLLTAHSNVIVGQGGVLHTMRMSSPPF